MVFVGFLMSIIISYGGDVVQGFGVWGQWIYNKFTCPPAFM